MPFLKLPGPEERDRAALIRWAASALVLAAGVAILLYAATVSVVAATQPGCAGCHMDDAVFSQATEQRAHASIDCVACHGGSTPAARVVFGNAQILGMYLRVAEVDPQLAVVARSTCVECHEAVFERTVESSGLRIRHSVCAASGTCAECHSVTAHGDAVSWPRSVTMDMCFDCHGASGVADDCELCHSGRLASDRISTGPFAVTHGPNYLETHGMGSMRTCVPCHDRSMCGRCHGAGLPHGADFVATHRASANAPDAECSTCHREDFCDDCHGYTMPHPAAFMAEHIEIVAADGDAGCARCHTERDCTRCHEMHVHPTTLEQLERLGVDVPDGGAR